MRSKAELPMKAPPLTSGDRLAFVDHMKAIGIIAIVIGHAPGISVDFEIILYGFHVPLFFFITGMLLSDRKLDQKATSFIFGQAREILIPYVVFFLIAYAYWLATRHIGNSAERFASMAWTEPIRGLFIGTGSSLFVNVVLWFFPALFSARLLYYVVRNILGNVLALVALTLLAFGHYSLMENAPYRLWFGVDCAIYGVVFLAAGRLCRSGLSRIHDTDGKMLLAFVALVISILYLVIALSNGKADLNNVYVGNFFLYFTAAFLGCAVVFSLSCLIPSNACSRWLSVHTLYIFPLHGLFFRVTTGVLQVFFGIPSPYDTGGMMWAVIYSIIGIGLVVPAAWVLNKLPFYPYAIARQGVLHET